MNHLFSAFSFLNIPMNTNQSTHKIKLFSAIRGERINERYLL